MSARTKKLVKAAKKLIEEYWCNKGTKHEFIACITPHEKQWKNITSMTDDDLRWEFCRLLEDADNGWFRTQRFRRVCYQMALRFAQQDLK